MSDLHKFWRFDAFYRQSVNVQKYWISLNQREICNYKVHKQQKGEENIPFCFSAIPLCNCLRKIAILDRKVRSTKMFIMYNLHPCCMLLLSFKKVKTCVYFYALMFVILYQESNIAFIVIATLYIHWIYTLNIYIYTEKFTLFDLRSGRGLNKRPFEPILLAVS